MLITWNGVQGLTITPMGMRLIVIEKKICCIHGETAYVFKSIKDASIKMNIPTTSIFNSLKRRSPMVSRGLMFYYVGKNEIPSFDEILEANKDVLERIKEKGD